MKFQTSSARLQRSSKSQGPNSASSSRGLGAWSFLPRGLALFLGGFCLLNLMGHFRFARFDANLWWIDLHWFPQPAPNLFLLVCAVVLVAFAVRIPHSGWRRRVTIGCAATLMVGAFADTAQFFVLLVNGAVHSGLPIPLSLFISAALGLILVAAVKRAATGRALPAFAVCLACIALFPLAQMLCFGKTDYRRPADAIVVLGARAYADGRPSQALADRVRTACRLYHDGLARTLIFSGGPGDGAVHETEAMKRMAISLGVSESDILLDKNGLNTQATVKNTEALFTQLHASRILVVSHFYHLPRVKLAYQRDGWNVYTVPAKESYLLGQLPYNMAREVAALWVYYFRPLGA